MSQAKLNDSGDLYFIFDEDYDEDIVTVFQLDNGAEVEFIDGKCVAIVLPSFTAKINRDIQNVELESFDIIDDVAYFNLDIGGQVVNGKINLSSLKE